MTPRDPDSRPRPRSLRSGAFFITLAALLTAPVGSAPAMGQEPDTLRAREAREAARERPAAQDTAVQDSVTPDTIQPPPPRLPRLGPTGPAGWTRGVWEWGRDDLLRLPDLSVLHLLERIPGVVPVRSDIVNQAEAGAVLGAGGGAIEYVIDGFVLDPLTAPGFDPARLSLLALERVRVERRVTGATVWIETLTPEEPRPQSVIEAGTGDYGVNLFRGIFLPPRVLNGAVGAGFERLSANGLTPGTSNQNVSWLKWTWATDSAGVQLEYRQSTLDRQGVGDPLASSRADWAVRARAARGPVTGEAYVGGTTVDDELGGEGGIVLREGAAQGGLRLAATTGGPVPVDARAAFRVRGHPRLPGRELEVGLRAVPLPWVSIEGEAVQGWWADGAPTGRWAARALAGPLLGVRAFAEVFRGGPLLGDGDGLALVTPADSLALRLSRDGLRAGLRLEWGGLVLGGAVLRAAADTAPGFGLPAEGGWRVAPGGEARGFEIVTRVPTGFDPLTVEGWYVGMEPPDGWLYVPRYHWRAGLVYHHRPLPSGNLEIFARAEHVFRGRMNVVGDPAGVAPVGEAGAYRATNFELMIRVVSVRAFFRWTNLMHRRDQADLPGFRLPGQHILWGVKWYFWN